MAIRQIEYPQFTNVVYGYKIERANSNPSTRVTYLEDNTNFTPAYMDYNTGTFNYGSWENAFFMPKPCMLKSSGKRDYYLNPNDYTKKLDGTSSDIANSSYDGNVMIEFPVIWTKHTTDGTYDYIYVSNYKVDSGYECYAHRDSDGLVTPYIYMPAYNGSLISSKVRSLSGQTCMYSQTGTNEITYAKANNPSGFDIWDTEVLADRILIQDLLVLIGKSTNTQAVFGNGHYTGGSSVSSLLQSGTMNSRGLFWGTNGTGNGVKVFGIENFWGNQWRRIRGWINANGTQKIKLTKGTYDGSTASDYNTDGSGYIAVSGATPSGTSGGYISTMACTAYGRIPSVASGSETTYECDGLWFNNSQVDYAFVGGGCDYDSHVGAFYSHLYHAVSYSSWHVGASLSCKPRVKDIADITKIKLGMPRLPSEYQEVEYVECSTTQYINTGITPSTNMRIKTKLASILPSNTYYIFGSQSNSQACYFGINTSGNFFTRYGGSFQESVVPYDLTPYTVDASINGTSYTHIVNGTTSSGTFTGSTETSLNMYLFANDYIGSLDPINQVRFYYFEIIKDNILIRNFIPCYLKSDGTIGMYDLVSKTFFQNAGSGTFTKGADHDTYGRNIKKVMLGTADGVGRRIFPSKLWLFNKGNQNINITGGYLPNIYREGTAQMTDIINVRGTSLGASGASMYSVNKVKLSGYSKIKINALTYNNTTFIGLRESDTVSYNHATSDFVNGASFITSRIGVNEFDISQYQGNYHIYVISWGSGGYLTADQLWLE